jgi:hypothetical protein
MSIHQAERQWTTPQAKPTAPRGQKQSKAKKMAMTPAKAMLYLLVSLALSQPQHPP